MTAEELTKLTVQQLATLVVQAQETIAQLQARLAELESVSLDSPKPASSDAAPIPVVRATSAEADRVLHRHHHKRRWYKRVWRAIFPANSKRQYVLIILVMIFFAIVLGMFVAENMNRVTPPKNPTPVKRVVKLREHGADVFVAEVDLSAEFTPSEAEGLRTNLGSTYPMESLNKKERFLGRGQTRMNADERFIRVCPRSSASHPYSLIGFGLSELGSKNV